MKISTQTGYYIRKGYSLERIVDILSEASFDCIDVSMHAFKNIKEYSADNMRALREYANNKGVVFNQAHAPVPSSVGEKLADEVIFEKIVHSMELAAALGIKHIIVHPKQHLRYRYNEEALKQMNYSFYKSLEPYCEKFNIKIAIENMWQNDENNGHIVPSTCAPIEEHMEYVDMLHSPWFVACLDIGHASLTNENAVESIKKLGNRLKALHVHDVDFVNDCHTLPGIQKVNYMAIMKALAENGYEGELTLEADMFLEGFEEEFAPEASEFMAKRSKFLADKFEKFKSEI